MAVNASLLVAGVSSQTLDAFVASVRDSIGTLSWERRQSSNYIDERYFRKSVLGLQVKAALADSDEFQGYRFWLLFEAAPGCISQIDFLTGLADCAARRLVQDGHEVIRPLDMGHRGRGAIVYRPNPDPDAKPAERVITEHRA